MTRDAPQIVWFTRDLRLRDHPALTAALAAGGPAHAVYIAETPDPEGAGAASRWRAAQAAKALAEDIAAIGGVLLFRRGDAAGVLAELAASVGARAVHATQSWHPGARARFEAAADALERVGATLTLHPGRYLFTPDGPQTRTGGFFKVYTPFWRTVSAEDRIADPLPAPARWPVAAGPEPGSVKDLGADAPMGRGAGIVARFAQAGEAAAQARLEAFLAERVGAYAADRDRLDVDGTSGLSAAFATGELSPRAAWRAARAAMEATPAVAEGAEVFLKEIVWREFAWHLAHHTPRILSGNWRSEWDGFPWESDGPAAARWRKGLTGVDVVDAALREIYVTGVMHNRARMLVASYLTKHLLTHWRVGEAWFRDCLIDFDPASNAMGWQWAAGSGPDASPFFRIFNPETQSEKFDPRGAYRRRWLPERFASAGPSDLFDGGAEEAPGALFFEAAPRAWALDRAAGRPDPMISLSDGRARALAAYEAVKAAA